MTHICDISGVPRVSFCLIILESSIDLCCKAIFVCRIGERSLVNQLPMVTVVTSVENDAKETSAYFTSVIHWVGFVQKYFTVFAHAFLGMTSLYSLMLVSKFSIPTLPSFWEISSLPSRTNKLQQEYTLRCTYALHTGCWRLWLHFISIQMNVAHNVHMGAQCMRGCELDERVMNVHMWSGIGWSNI